jgi:tRNA nucleotidyltransferase (CCA-adding enzyme)
MYFIVLINSLSLYDIRKILLRFCFRRGEEKRVLSYKKITPKVITALSSKQIRASGIFALLEHLSYEVILLLQARYKNRLLSKHIRDFFQSYNGMRSHIRGKDLRELGIVPGPAYQRILTKVLNARLDGLVSSRREELALLKELIKA